MPTESQPNPYASPLARSPAIPAGAKWSLLLLLGINLFNYIDRQVLAAVEVKIESEFNASSALAGLLATAFLASYMVAAPIFGWLADRYNRWLLIGGGVLVWSLASGASGLATGIGVMLLTRLFVGVGEAAYGPAAPAILADLYPVERRGRILAFFYVAIPVGSALGYLLAGAVLKAGLSWRWAFYLVVPPGIVLALLSMLRRDQRSRDANGAIEHHKLTIRDYQILARTPSYVLNTLGMTFMTFALGGIGYWIPKYIVWRQATAGLLDLHDTTAVDQALANANGFFGPIVVVSGLLGTLLGGAAGDWFRARAGGSYFLVSGAAMALAFPLFILLPATPFPLAWALIFATSFCLFFNTGPTNTILANVTHPALRATGYAINIFVIHAFGDAISPPLIGKINDLWGGNMNAGFMAISITILLGGLCWLWAARYLARDTELAPTRIGR